MRPWVAPEKRAVGDERDIVAEATPDERRGHRQHLAHARPADRPFAADDDDVALAMRPSWTASNAASSPSNTRAGPLKTAARVPRA